MLTLPEKNRHPRDGLSTHVLQDVWDSPVQILIYNGNQFSLTINNRDGVSVKAIAVAVAMGHSCIQTAKYHYAFPSLEQKREAMNSGDSLIVTKTNEKKE